MRNGVLWGVAILVLGFVNLQIWQKEQLLRDGDGIFLKLAPRDPRSLIQGDYMVLRYTVSRNAYSNRENAFSKKKLPRKGRLVVRIDAKKVAHFARFHSPGTPLKNNEHLLRYRFHKYRILIGAEAFHFQEGHARCYNVARYGQLKVKKDGLSVLAGLYDKNFHKIQPKANDACKRRPRTNNTRLQRPPANLQQPSKPIVKPTSPKKTPAPILKPAPVRRPADQTPNFTPMKNPPR